MFDPSALVAGDDFFGFLRNGALAPWTAESHRQNEAVTDAAGAAAGRLTGWCTVVYDGVVGPWFLPRFARATGAERLHYVLLVPALDTCVERVRSRIAHGFTDLDAARHMHAQFADPQIDARHVVRDEHRSAEQLAELIREQLPSGRFEYRDHTLTSSRAR
jgi:hypothetical protein